MHTLKRAILPRTDKHFVLMIGVCAAAAHTEWYRPGPGFLRRGVRAYIVKLRATARMISGSLAIFADRFSSIHLSDTTQHWPGPFWP